MSTKIKQTQIDGFCFTFLHTPAESEQGILVKSGQHLNHSFLVALKQAQREYDEWSTRIIESDPATYATPNIANGTATAGFVYLIQSPTKAYKIGRSINPNRRIKTFAVALPFEVEFTCIIKTDNMYALEAELHQRFSDKRIGGEWFELVPDDVEYIKSLAVEA